MPSTSIGDCSIRYRVLGKGVPLVLTPGGRCPLELAMPLAEKLAAHCRVIVWDRANLGGSDVLFRGASDLDLWADQLEQLLRQLDAWPAYLAGASSGARVSIRTALRYPDAVRGMFLWLLSGGPVAVPLARTYYGEAAEIAERDGMQAVAAMPYWADRIRANPANRARMLAENPRQFASVMRRWASQIRAEDLLIGAPEEDLRRLAVPVRIVDGSDDSGHLRERAQRAAALIPGAELIAPAGFREAWLEIKQRAPVGTGYERVPQVAGLIADFVDAGSRGG
ncbi:MAG: alpha/beta hydrolase [Betaproteobacteria bacterium]|nr:alpha/beta hydrolase [Betaproteobacteria bacterium]